MSEVSWFLLHHSVLPASLLVLGTTYWGGANGNGNVFRITILPQLSIAHSGDNTILTWPQSAIGFALQSATNLNPPVNWGVVTPAPIIVNRFNTVINPSTSEQRFYRLSQ